MCDDPAVVAVERGVRIYRGEISVSERDLPLSKRATYPMEMGLGYASYVDLALPSLHTRFMSRKYLYNLFVSANEL